MPQIGLYIEHKPHPNSIFEEIGKLILKFVWKCKGQRIIKATLKELSGFKTYSKYNNQDSVEKA